jgi:NADH-quinone oxidoreductase subunit H
MTEFSGFRWALYFLAEYANIFVISSVAVTLFWGGWLRPFPSVKWPWLDYALNNVFPFLALAGTGGYCFPLAFRLKNRPRALFLMFIGACLIVLGLPFLLPVVSAVVSPLFWFFFKVSLLVYSMIWFRATWPRFRYDQLMNIGWRRLIPLGMAAVLVNAIVGMLLKK